MSAETSDIFGQGEDSESCGGSWGDLLKNPDDLLDCEPETRSEVSAVPDVTVVPVSSSSMVTEHLEDVSLDSDWEFVVGRESRGDGVRRVASRSASEYQKKDDAVYATANFASSNRLKPVARGAGSAKLLEHSGKKSNGGSGKLLGKVATI